MESYALLAFRHAPSPIVVLSYRRIKELNDAFANLFGYERDELLNQSMQKLFPSIEDFEKIGKEALTGLTLQTNLHYCDERFMRHKTGGIFWAKTHGRTLTPDDPFKLAIWHFEKKPQEMSESQLTAREAQISQYVVNGYTCKEIGKLLNLSPRTVEVHKANLMKKLGVRAKAELASKIIVIDPVAATHQNYLSN